MILGVIKKVAEVNGIIALPPVRDTLSHLAMQVAMLEGLIEAENAEPESWPNGYVAQDRQAMYATMAWTTTNYYQLHQFRARACSAATRSSSRPTSACSITR